MRCAALVLGLASLLAGAVQAATVVAVVGDVQVVRSGASAPVAVGTALREGDELVSREDSEAIVRFDDGGRFAIRPATRSLLKQLPPGGAPDTASRIVSITKGALRYVSAVAGGRGPQFETGTATIGIRGTDIDIVVTEVAIANEPPGTLLRVRAGLALIRGSDGTETDVRAGQIAYGGEPDAPTRGLGSRRRPGARLVTNVNVQRAFQPGRLDSAFN